MKEVKQLKSFLESIDNPMIPVIQEAVDVIFEEEDAPIKGLSVEDRKRIIDEEYKKALVMLEEKIPKGLEEVRIYLRGIGDVATGARLLIDMFKDVRSTHIDGEWVTTGLNDILIPDGSSFIKYDLAYADSDAYREAGILEAETSGDPGFDELDDYIHSQSKAFEHKVSKIAENALESIFAP